MEPLAGAARAIYIRVVVLERTLRLVGGLLGVIGCVAFLVAIAGSRNLLLISVAITLTITGAFLVETRGVIWPVSKHAVLERGLSLLVFVGGFMILGWQWAAESGWAWASTDGARAVVYAGCAFLGIGIARTVVILATPEQRRLQRERLTRLRQSKRATKH